MLAVSCECLVLHLDLLQPHLQFHLMSGKSGEICSHLLSCLLLINFWQWLVVAAGVAGGSPDPVRAHYCSFSGVTIWSWAGSFSSCCQWHLSFLVLAAVATAQAGSCGRRVKKTWEISLLGGKPLKKTLLRRILLGWWTLGYKRNHWSQLAVRC